MNYPDPFWPRILGFNSYTKWRWNKTNSVKSGPHHSPTGIITPDFFWVQICVVHFSGQNHDRKLRMVILLFVVGSEIPRLPPGMSPKPISNEAQVVRNAIFLNTNSMLGGVFFPVEVSYPLLRRNTWARMEAIWVAMVSPCSLVVLAGYGAPPWVVAAVERVDAVFWWEELHDCSSKTSGKLTWNWMAGDVKLQSPSLLIPKHHLLVYQISGVLILFLAYNHGGTWAGPELFSSEQREPNVLSKG